MQPCFIWNFITTVFLKDRMCLKIKKCCFTKKNRSGKLLVKSIIIMVIEQTACTFLSSFYFKIVLDFF